MHVNATEVEIRQGKSFNDTKIDSGLCQKCNKIDFKTLAYYDPPCGFSEELHVPYGSISSLADRRDCRLCHFMWKEVRWRGSLPESNHDVWQTSITIGMSHQVARKNIELKKSSGSRADLHTNQFSLICYKPDNKPSQVSKIPPTTLLTLDPAIHPIPTATERGYSVEVLEEFETSKFSARILPSSGFADLTLCSRWLKLCAALHGDACSFDALCAEKMPKGFTVIDVHRFCLVSAPTDCCYVTLSYVWGRDPFLTCTLENVAKLHLPGALFAVPRTIMDAMAVAKALQQRYLWVDALCIIQDSEESLLEHIAHMGTVYARSTLTVVAQTTTKADDGLNGVSHSNDRITQNVIDVKGLTLVASSPHTLDDLLWSRRGWTMQEELLSRRQLIFGKREIIWKCRKATWLESAVLEVEKSLPHIPINGREDIQLLDMFQGSSTEEVQRALARQLRFRQTYQTVTKTYFARQLTYPSDKLHAYKAVEDALSLSNDDRFVYGLPESCFTKALCWVGTALVRNEALHKERDEAGQARHVRFPSWSWCAWEGAQLAPMREQQSPITVFLCRDGSGTWRRIEERTRLALPSAPEQLFHEPDLEAGSHPTPLLCFHTSTIALTATAGNLINSGLTEGRYAKEPWCILESPLVNRPMGRSRAATRQLQCEIDVHAVWEYASNIEMQKQVQRKQRRWLWSRDEDEAIHAKASARTFVGAAVGRGLMGQYIFCLILEPRGNGTMERVGGVQLDVAVWEQLEKIEQVVTLA